MTTGKLVKEELWLRVKSQALHETFWSTMADPLATVHTKVRSIVANHVDDICYSVQIEVGADEQMF